MEPLTPAQPPRCKGVDSKNPSLSPEARSIVETSMTPPVCITTHHQSMLNFPRGRVGYSCAIVGSIYFLKRYIDAPIHVPSPSRYPIPILRLRAKQQGLPIEPARSQSSGPAPKTRPTPFTIDQPQEFSVGARKPTDVCTMRTPPRH